MSSAHSPTFPSLHLRHNSFSNPTVALPTSQLILQPPVASPTSQSSAHSPYFPSLHLRHNSLSNPSVALPTSSSFSNLPCFTYVTELCSFSIPSVTSPTSQLILQPFRRFTYVTAHSPNARCFTYVIELCSFSILSVTSPTLQLILQPYRRFTYVTAHSPTLPSLHLHHSSFSNPSFSSPTS